MARSHTITENEAVAQLPESASERSAFLLEYGTSTVKIYGPHEIEQQTGAKHPSNKDSANPV